MRFIRVLCSKKSIEQKLSLKISNRRNINITLGRVFTMKCGNISKTNCLYRRKMDEPENITCKLFTVSGMNGWRRIRLTKEALPILKWLGQKNITTKTICTVIISATWNTQLAVQDLLKALHVSAGML